MEPDLSSGQFLYTKCLKSQRIKRVGKNKITVEFLSAEDANNPLLQMNKYVATITTCNIIKLGVVCHIPRDWSDRFRHRKTVENEK